LGPRKLADEIAVSLSAARHGVARLCQGGPMVLDPELTAALKIGLEV
jgi:hypothetical protein